MNTEWCNWCSEVKWIFFLLGLEEAYNRRLLCDLYDSKETIWNVVAQDEWNKQAQAKPKL